MTTAPDIRIVTYGPLPCDVQPIHGGRWSVTVPTMQPVVIETANGREGLPAVKEVQVVVVKP